VQQSEDNVNCDTPEPGNINQVQQSENNVNCDTLEPGNINQVQQSENNVNCAYILDNISFIINLK
jgi:hypothetical protein